MAKAPVELTLIDQEVLNSYSNFINGLGHYLGDACEIVLHSLENYEHSIINILNGEHTGRKIGAPITDLALNMLDKLAETQVDHITYFSTNKKGEPLKSATIAIHGEKNRIIGLLCINFYMNTPLSSILNSLMPEKASVLSNQKSETFVDSSDELIETMFMTAQEKVLQDSSITPSNKNKMIVYILDDNGIFNIKDAVVKVSKLLNISKNTVYMHLRNKAK